MCLPYVGMIVRVGKLGRGASSGLWGRGASSGFWGGGQALGGRDSDGQARLGRFKGQRLRGAGLEWSVRVRLWVNTLW